jgi:hypothetical protein
VTRAGDDAAPDDDAARESGVRRSRAIGSNAEERRWAFAEDPDRLAGSLHPPGSGDRAVAAAAQRAKVTATRNIPVFGDLPVPADTANLREGVDLHEALLALLPLVGVWRGEGEGRGADGDYRFGQQIVVSHDGGDYLNWEARSWRVDHAGDYHGPDLR